MYITTMMIIKYFCVACTGFINTNLLLIPDMAENADEDSSTGIDLICALCDNGGEIPRYMFIYFLFYLL
jgi:hypothetical protein